MAERKQWRDLSTGRKISTVIMGIIQVSLLVVALYDLRRRPEAQINGSKKMWTGLVFINWIGPIAYFLVGRKRERTGLEQPVRSEPQE